MGLIVQDLKSRNIFMGLLAQTGNNKQPAAVQDLFFPLVGAQRLSIKWQHDIGQKQGLTANFLQPWYNKPVEIEVQGQSYIGMFGGSSLEEVLSQNTSNNQKIADNQVTNKLKNAVNSGINKLGKAISNVVDSIRYGGLSEDLLAKTPTEFCTPTAANITLDQFKSFLSPFNNWELYASLPVKSILSSAGKSAVELKAFIETHSPTWLPNNSPLKSNIGSVISGVSSALSSVTNPVGGYLKNALQKNVELLKRNIGPKEDKTVDNLKKLISYFDYGPYRKKPGYSKIQHILLIENETGNNSTDTSGTSSAFATFIGYVRDLNYTESIDAPFIYDYTVSFIGLPDTAMTIEQSTVNATTDAKRGGITVNIVSGSALLQNAIGSIAQFPKISIPKIG